MKTKSQPVPPRRKGGGHPLWRLAVLLLVCALPGLARAAPVMVAVAANFTEPAKRLAAAFEQKTGDAVIISSGASGQLFAQIVQGAPYEIFLSADAARPAKLVQMGLADSASRFTYAIGRLVLFSAMPGYVDPQGEVLREGKYTHLAIADPRSAPYGAAAVEVLRKLGVYDEAAPRLVIAKDIAQAYQFTASGNAELGFVALSQVINAKGGSQWLVPPQDYQPIRQDAVLLKSGAADPAARAFFAYLHSPEARAVIRAYGYATAP